MIKKDIEELLQLNDKDFGFYQFSLDPLKGKISLEEQDRVIDESIKCGLELSRELKTTYGLKTMDEYLTLLEIKLEKKDTHSGLEYIYFGTYQKPNKVTIYTENIQKGQDLVKDMALAPFEQVQFEDVVKAHELFHHFEEKRADMFVNQYKIPLWSIGKYQRKSGLVAPAEIASMAFAKDLLSLAFAPNVLDFVLLYPQNKELAVDIKKNILEAAEKNKEVNN